jgi:glycosyltransferase involved in cell wall biosynthesis
MKILITNHHLDSRAGSELFTATLSLELKKRNHHVYVFSPILGKISDEIKKSGVIVVDDLRILKEEKFDIIHAQHNDTAILARSIFPNIPMIFMSHGVLPELEQVPSIDLGIAKFIAVSEEVEENLVKNNGISKDRVEIIRNFVDTETFCLKKEVNETPKNILVVTNHYTDDVKKIIEGACADLGIVVSHVGLPDNPVTNVEKYMNDVDIVVTLGRGSLEAMACERNVIVFDMHGGDGLIDERNFFEIRKNNFSGRRFRNKYSVEEFKDEINKYKPELGHALRKIIEVENSISGVIDDLERIYKEVSLMIVINSQIKVGQLYNEIFFLEKSFREKAYLIGLIQEKDCMLEQKECNLDEKNKEIDEKNKEIYSIRTSLRWKIPNFIYKKYKKIISFFN